MTVIFVDITKNLKSLRCGSIEEVKDTAGNSKYKASNIIDSCVETFYTQGGAKLWLELCGYNRG